MKKFDILLKTIVDVRNYVNIVNQYECKIDLISGRYTINGKSIMGIFTFNLNEPLKIQIHSESCDKLLDEIKGFMVETA